MRLVTSSDDLRALLARVDRIVDRGARLPNQVFRPGFGRWIFGDSAYFAADHVHAAAAALARAAGDAEYFVVALEPSPGDYFSDAIGFQGSFVVGCEEPRSSFNEGLLAHGHGSTADSIVHRADVALVASNASSWALVCDRDFELCVWAFVDQDRQSIARQHLDAKWSTNVADALVLIGLPYKSRSVPDADCDAFTRAYTGGVST